MIQCVFQGLNASIRCHILKSPFTTPSKEIHLWRWFYNLFNMVDYDRLKKVGPDRSCAEWVLKNGGSVKFKTQKDFISDYNNLAPDNDELVRDHLVEIFANDATMNSFGFEHFKDCNHIRKITFISCQLVGDPALERLKLYQGRTLKDLEIKSCPSITDEGVLHLTGFSNLDTLILHDLPSVSNKKNCETVLQDSLKKTHCNLKL